MPNVFQGVGNLADAPSIKNCTTRKGKPIKAAEMRVFFDEYSKTANDGYEQSGGLWLPVSMYEHTAENCARLLRKGSRVKVEGRLVQFVAHDNAGNPVTACSIVASAVYLSMSRIETVHFSESKNRGNLNGVDEVPLYDGEFEDQDAQAFR